MAGPLDLLLGMPSATRCPFRRATGSWKVSVNIAPMQASDEGHLVLLNLDAQPIVSDPDPVVMPGSFSLRRFGML